jgi:hypothetical protein
MHVSSVQTWPRNVCERSGRRGLCCVCVSAQHNCVLQDLRLNSNAIGADGVKALSEALKVCSDRRAVEQGSKVG